MMLPIRAVFFDAVGTLLHPSPSAAQAYFQAGQRHGSRLSLDTVSTRFTVAFRAEEQADAHNAHRTSEARERERWRRIVASVLDDVRDAETCFAELYQHFADARHWRCEPDAGAVIARLRQSGIVVGIASNFDQRLHSVVATTSDIASLDYVAVSSELGWKKPASAFYSALSAMTGLSAGEILLVGDDAENDVVAPKRCGMQALLFDPKNRSTGDRIGRLGELLARVRG